MTTTYELDADPQGELNPTPAPCGAGTVGRICRPATAAQRALPLLLGPLLCAAGLAVTADAQAVGETTRVSVNSAGIGGNDGSSSPALSADGRFVAFASGANNLVPGDTKNTSDIFVRDRQTHQTTRVSVDSQGNSLGGYTLSPAISADGRIVAFQSFGGQLHPNIHTWADIFAHDRQTHQTTLISVNTEGNVVEDSISVEPAISENGRFVAFTSNARLVPEDYTILGYDIYVHDRHTGQNTLVSVNSAGEQGHADYYSSSTKASISADGRIVAFQSDAKNLVPGDTNDGGNSTDVFVHDRQTHRTTRVSVDSNSQQANDQSNGATISADGRFVAFSSSASNLVPGDTNEEADVFVHDRQTHRTTRVSVDSAGSQANGSSFLLTDDSGSAVSADGRFVSFFSDASNLVPGDTNGEADVFVHDRQTHQTTRVSVDSQDNQAVGSSYNLAISADGRFVAFESRASNLATGDNNDAAFNLEDVFVRDRLLDRTASADLAITQTVSPSPFPASSPITFTLNVVNHGPDPAGEVTLVDRPLRGAAVTSQGTCSTGAPMVCYLGTLAAGARATVTLTLPPRGTGTPRVYNAAQVSAAPLDPHRANNKTALHASVAP